MILGIYHSREKRAKRKLTALGIQLSLNDSRAPIAKVKRNVIKGKAQIKMTAMKAKIVVANPLLISVSLKTLRM